MEDFLRLVHDAEYVVSNSFHGVAFSLIFQKQFFAVGMGAKANRVVSLLGVAGIPERYIVDAKETPTLFKPIDYEIVEGNLQSIVAKSINYLKRSIEQ